MTHPTHRFSKALILITTASALTLGAPIAAAGNNEDPKPNADNQAWEHKQVLADKTAHVVRIDEHLPEALFDLEIDVQTDGSSAVLSNSDYKHETSGNFEEFDLIDNSPLFIGSQGVSDLDKRDAQRDSGSFPETLDIDPFYTVAGTGVSTKF